MIRTPGLLLTYAAILAGFVGLLIAFVLGSLFGFVLAQVTP